jgi:hypothetical protein
VGGLGPGSPGPPLNPALLVIYEQVSTGFDVPTPACHRTG